MTDNYEDVRDQLALLTDVPADRYIEACEALCGKEHTALQSDILTSLRTLLFFCAQLEKRALSLSATTN